MLLTFKQDSVYLRIAFFKKNRYSRHIGYTAHPQLFNIVNNRVLTRINKDVQKLLRIEALRRETTQQELLSSIVGDWLVKEGIEGFKTKTNSN